MPNLTKAQRKDLDQMVATFKANEDAFRENCDIIITIRDEELWRDDAESFTEFCEKILGITRQRGYQMIGAAELLRDAPTIVGAAIKNEAQARTLAKVPKSRRAEVVEAASEGGEPVTAKRLQEAADDLDPPFIRGRKAKDDAPEIRDELDLLITDKDHAPIFEAGVDLFKKLDKAIKTCLDDAEFLTDDPAGIFLRSGWQSLEADLKNAREKVKAAAPFAICCYCHNGQGRSECKPCRKTGWLPRGLYKAAAEGLRALAEKKRGKKE